jgi:hypothetical protein
MEAVVVMIGAKTVFHQLCASVDGPVRPVTVTVATRRRGEMCFSISYFSQVLLSFGYRGLQP